MVKILKWFGICMLIYIIYFVGYFVVSVIEDDRDYGIPKLEAQEKMRQEQHLENIKWLGEYEFVERVSDNEYITYNIKIDDHISAELQCVITITSNDDIWEVRAYGNNWSEDNVVKFVFYEYLQKDTVTEFVDGDILLEFKYSIGNLLTYWGKIKPQLEENCVDGQIYFKHVFDRDIEKK